ncbi:MAG: tetratricopeptide repeat protein [Acidobacteriaceae bacterium]|nr:tetratricopeptide repeat protein [Acidobacteriaceae bacterium]MBV9780064.1 tetratricopeptide repeat protein [Acidobacteriaceae bacterium]
MAAHAATSQAGKPKPGVIAVAPADPLRIVYRCAEIEIDCRQGCIRREGGEQYLRPQSFHILIYLIEHRDRLVSKEELIENFWPGISVTDNALVQCVADIRKVLSDDPHQPRFVKTIPRIGYRFIGPLEECCPHLVEPVHAHEGIETSGASGHQIESAQGELKSKGEEIKRPLIGLAQKLALAAFAAGVFIVFLRFSPHPTERHTDPPLAAPRSSGLAADHRPSAPSSTANETSLAEVMTNNLEAYRYYSLGVREAQGFENAQAVELLHKAVQVDPTFAMAYARIGFAYAVTDFLPEKGKPYLEKAIQLSDHLTEKDRLYVTAWYAIARNDYPAAIAHLRQIVTEYPAENEAYARLGRLLYREEHPAEAIATLQQGLTTARENSELYNVLGICYLGLMRYEEAIAAHQRYVQLDPKEPNAHDSLGMSYEQSGRFDEALDEYKAALFLNPAFEPAMIHLGDVYAQRGQYREAIRQYERYIRVTRSNAARAVGYGSIAQVWQRMHEPARGEIAAKNEMKCEKGAVWNSLLFALDRGDTVRASQLKEKLFENFPYPERGVRQELRSYDYYLGTLALKRRETEQAISHFKSALQHLPPSSGLDLYEDCLANAYLETGHPDEAIAEYRRILRLNPSYPLAEYHSARAYEQKCQFDQSRLAYERFLRISRYADPDVPEVIHAKRSLAAAPQPVLSASTSAGICR